MKKLITISILTATFAFTAHSQASTTYAWSDTVTGYYQQTTDVYFNPNTDGTTISGTIDLANMAAGDVETFGLIDKKLYDDGGYMWQSGAYIYIYKTATDVKVGTSDGNIGGEITANATSVGAVNSVDFSMSIYNGQIELTSSLFSGTKTSAYGTVKTYNNAYGYSWDEFEYGAYLGGCVWPSSTVGIDVTATNAVPEPATMALLGLGGVFSLISRKRKTA